MNIHVAIASFGRYEVIQAYLDKAFGFTDFTVTPTPSSSFLSSMFTFGSGTPAKVRYFTRENISTPSTVGGTDGWSLQGGKNQQLTALMQKYDANLQSTLFFDGK